MQFEEEEFEDEPQRRGGNGIMRGAPASIEDLRAQRRLKPVVNVLNELDRSNLFSWLERTILRALDQQEREREREEAKTARSLAKSAGKRKKKSEDDEGQGDEGEEAEAEDVELFMFELRHLASKSSAPVERFEYEHGKTVLEELCEEIAQRAEDDASGIGQLCRYILVSDIATGRHAFSVTPPELEGEGFSEDAPNAQGLVSQSIRHTEVLLQSHVTTSMQREKMLMRENSDLRKRIERLEDRHAKALSDQEEALSRKHERDLELRREAKHEERMDQVVDGIKMGVPALMNRFLGDKALPESSTPERELAKNFFGSVTQEQFEGMSLTPIQRITFLELYKKFSDEEARKRGIDPDAEDASAASQETQGDNV